MVVWSTLQTISLSEDDVTRHEKDQHKLDVEAMNLCPTSQSSPEVPVIKPILVHLQQLQMKTYMNIRRTSTKEINQL